jgi:hypothetical protein
VQGVLKHERRLPASGIPIRDRRVRVVQDNTCFTSVTGIITDPSKEKFYFLS